jgi:glucokinase
MLPKKIYAADVGGSHISVASFVPSSGGQMHLDDMYRVHVDSTDTKEKILDHWHEAIQQVAKTEKDIFLGMAMPAPFDYENGICLIEEQDKFRDLFQVNIKHDLAQRLKIPKGKINFINDAAAFLLGESQYGSGKGAENILGITLGSGLGSAIKKDGQVKDAALWSSHFKDGKAEDYLGTSFFVEWSLKNLGIQIEGVKELIDPQGLLQRASPAFDAFAQNLADFIAIQCSALGLDMVIMGGNISKSANLFLHQTEEHLSSQGFYPALSVSDLGEKGALYGAASLFINEQSRVQPS